MPPPNRKLTIAVPLYNEAKNLPELFSRLETVLASMPNLDHEILLIDNHSVDESSVLCLEMTAVDPRYKYLAFSRNFGIEASFQAAITYGEGDAVIFVFSDLQDPPELIPEFVRQWELGYDMVYGKLEGREDHTFFKALGAYFAYHIIHLLSDVNIPRNATDFRLLSSKVIQVLRSCPERSRYMRGLTHWAGYRSIAIPFKRVPRKHGKTNAGFWWCVQYAFHAVISFSTKPLKLASLMGLLMTGMSVLGSGIYVLHLVLTRMGLNYHVQPPPPGWTTIVMMALFFGGLNCLFLGIIGEYIAQIHQEVKARPHFVVGSKSNF
jgi:glycosyltransferase involved in cell wall biosynthesis